MDVLFDPTVKQEYQKEKDISFYLILCKPFELLPSKKCYTKMFLIVIINKVDDRHFGKWGKEVFTKCPNSFVQDCSDMVNQKSSCLHDTDLPNFETCAHVDMLTSKF